MAHFGHCLCGRVRFEISSDPLWVGYCHCASCRRHTASPVAAFAGFDENNVKFLLKTPQSYESSPDTWRSFCGNCGSPICYRSRRYPRQIHFYIGVMDQPEQYVPQGHAYFSEHVEWFDTRDGLARHERTGSEA